MTVRQMRHAAEHKARKLARKSGLPVLTSAAAAPEATTTIEIEAILAAAAVGPQTTVPEEENTFPSPLSTISPARLAANRRNAQLSTGAKLPETRAISAQNHTIHGLARHQNGNFKLLSSEDSAGYQAFKQSLLDEHQPATPTESILVNGMAESHWLAGRAQRLQDTCMNPDTGDITDDKKFSLYMRYQTTHTRAFHKSLNDLLKLRGEKRKAELGFEAQKRQEQDQRLKSERHEMKKQTHDLEVLKKDAQVRHQIGANASQQAQGYQTVRGFEEKFAEELAKHGLVKEQTQVISQAA